MGLTTQKYDILSRIAVGHGALVYRALDKATMRQVALKLFQKDGDWEHRLDVEALVRDAPRFRQITGAHVCQLLEAYDDEDGAVFVYEFANGPSGLDVPSKRKLDAGAALDVAGQLISALRSGERQRCPHGDLKPSNIILVELPEGRPFVLVLDWGLEAYRHLLPDESLPFVAPERLAGGVATHRSDLFSAGAVLFFLFTGRTLAGGATADELRKTWPLARPAMLAELRPDLPPKLVQWVCGLLELDPEKRPLSAVEAGTTLAALNPPPPPVPPESIRPRATAGASGIARALASPASVPNAAVRATAAPAVSPAPAAPPKSSVLPKPPATLSPSPAEPPPKAPRRAVTVSIWALGAAVSVGGIWFAISKISGSAAKEEDIRTAAAKPVAGRQPAASVGPPIGIANTRKTPAPEPASPPTAKPPDQKPDPPPKKSRKGKS